MLVTEAIFISDWLPKMTWGSYKLGGVDSLPRSGSVTGILDIFFLQSYPFREG